MNSLARLETLSLIDFIYLKSILLVLLLCFFSSNAYSFDYQTGGCATGGCAVGEDWLDTNANEVDSALDAVEDGTNVTVGGDVSGTASAVVITDDSHDHGTTTLNGVLFTTDIGGTVQGQSNVLQGLADGNGNLLTSGVVQSTLDVVTDTSTLKSVGVLEVLGTFHVSNSASNTTYDLPTAVTGMELCIYDLDGLGTVTINPQGVDPTGDRIILDSTALAIGVAVVSPGDIGDKLCLVAITDTTWVTAGRTGAWVSE